MLNKFLVLILSLCLVIACGLFMASCGGGSDFDTDTVVSETDSDTDSTTDTDSSTDSSTDSDSTDIEAAKEQMLIDLQDAWNQLMQCYPELAQSEEYATKFNNLLKSVNSVNTQKDLDGIAVAFGKISEEINNNFTLDFNAYKQAVRQNADKKWKGLCDKYSDLIKNEEYTSRYNDLLNRIEQSATEDGVTDVANMLTTLFSDIENYYKNQQGGEDKPEDIERYKTEIKTNFNSAWESYLTLYPDLKSSDEFLKKYATLLNEVENATTKQELAQLQEQFNAILVEIEETFGIDINAYRKMMEDYMSGEWGNALARYPELAGNNQMVSNYNGILTALSVGTTEKELNDAMDSFYNLMREIDNLYNKGQEVSDERRAEVIKLMETTWNEILKKIPQVAGSNFETEYDNLKNRAQTATTEEELNSLYNIFVELEKKVNDLAIYREDIKSRIAEDWQTYLVKYTDLESRDEFKNRYNEIISAIDAASDTVDVDGGLREFETLLQDIEKYYSTPTVEGTIQICLPVIESELTSFRNAYADKITDEIQTKIDDLYQKFYSSSTIEEVYQNRENFLEYLSKAREELDNQQTEAELRQRKTELQSWILDKYNIVTNDYKIYDLGEAVGAKQNALNQEIESATTLAQLNELESKISNEYFPYLENTALKIAINQIKKEINEKWDTYSASAPDLKQLKDQLLYVAGLCKNSGDTYWLEFSCLNAFECAIQNNSSIESVVSAYCELTSFYTSLFDEKIIEIATKKLDMPDDYGDMISYVKSSESINQADEKFKNIVSAVDALKDMVYLVDAELSEDLKIEVTVGSSKDDLIKKIVSGLKIIGCYNDKTTKEFSITSDMVKLDNVDLTKIGTYYASVYFKNEEYEKGLSVTVCITPDMSNAKVAGEYSSTGYFLGDTSRGGDLKITLYDNGYLKFSDRYNGYLTYTDKGNYIEINFGYGAEYSVGLFTLDKKENKFDYYRPEGSTIIEFFGDSVGFPPFIAVYGTYSVAGQYIAICDYDMRFDENGRYYGWTTYCTLDMENKKFDLSWIKSDIEKDELYTWEDKESPCTLKYDLTECKEQAKKQINDKWDELIEKGYDVSYWVMMGQNKDNYLSQVDMATYRSEIEDLLMRFDGLLEEIKNNRISTVQPDFDTTSFNLTVGDDLQQFFDKNVIEKTITLR